ncbi:MAG: hypothetical protein II680_11220, partial [Clostridia bacterium]|nr:hypothetical protein [Clostridia bacterium]
KAAGLVLRMFQLHQHRPREVGLMFRLVHSAICKSARGSADSQAAKTRVFSIVAQRAERSHQKSKIPLPKLHPAAGNPPQTDRQYQSV